MRRRKRSRSQIPTRGIRRIGEAFKKDERAQVMKSIAGADDSWIPEETKQGVADFAAGWALDLDNSLNERYPGD